MAGFERAWKNGPRPAIGAHLPAEGPVRQAALIELVHVDFEFRTKAGHAPNLVEYLTRFPELSVDRQSLENLFSGPGPRPAAPPAVETPKIFTLSELHREKLPGSSGGELATTPRVVLEVLTGPHQGQRFEFDRHETLLAGRASIVQLRLNQDPHFSRHHFLLEINPPRCQLTDLESMNGTFVNGRRVRDAVLQPEDIISGGATRIRFAVVGAKTISDDQPARNVSTQSEATKDFVSVPFATPAAPSQATGLDRRIPGFEVQAELGRGGMGIVYRAVQKSSGRILALKVMKPAFATNMERLRFFVREASILSQLNHPHIIRFVEMGTVNGEFFVATEYVETIPLGELIQGQPSAYRVKVVCGIACHVLEALKYAHDSGLVHRDIKPTNILLTRVPRKLNAKLADFGLAKNYEDAGFSDMTSDGEMRGSPAFISPEQIINARYAKPACDLYSLGVTLYQMFSGRFPYDVLRTGSIFRAILEDPPIPLVQVAPDVPAEVAALIHRAMAKEPGDRFASADEMHRAFYPFRRGNVD